MDRNWKWFVPVACVGGLLAIATFIVMIVMIVFSTIKSSDAYKQAVQTAKNDSRVISAIGAPLKEGLFVTGNISVGGSSGQADLAIPISGPKSSGTIYAVASKSVGVWNFSSLVVEVNGSSQRINLLAGNKDDSPPPK